MAGSFSRILLHTVFSTKQRTPWITPEVAERLHAYLGGIIRAEHGVPCEIGGAADHVHLFVRWRPDVAVSDMLRIVKSRSSAWVHDIFPALAAFAWQSGYAVSTVSPSQSSAVTKYVAGQAKHHRKEDFSSEFRRLLRAHGIKFDERYVLD